MTFWGWLAQAPQDVILGVMIVLVIFLIAMPVALRFAGLSGQQIADLLSLTLQFFVNLLHEFRADNQGKG